LNKFLANGEIPKTQIEIPPADSPKIVIFSLSPPKDSIISLVNLIAAI